MTEYMVGASDSLFGGPEFESRSEDLLQDLLSVVPKFKSSATLVNKVGSCVAFVCVKNGKVVSQTLIIANKTPTFRQWCLRRRRFKPYYNI